MISRLSTIATALAIGAAAQGQWAVVELHPTGADSSRAVGVRSNEQVGHASFAGVQKAGVWQGSAGSWVELSPVGTSGAAIAVDNGLQAGVSNNAAALWSGSAGSWVELIPVNSTESSVLGARSGQQVGTATIGGIKQAGRWSGTSGSWVSLHTVGATESVAFGTDGAQQVGYATFFGTKQAGLWTGTAGSRQSLHPAGATESTANAVDSGTQVGYAFYLGMQRASIWRGNIGSWISVHPFGATHSSATAIDGDLVAGWARFSGVNRAGAWLRTSNSWLDLTPFLPTGYAGPSEAVGAWSDQGRLYVVGSAFHKASGSQRALMWVSEAVSPSYTAVRGVETGGNQQSLESSDDDRLTFRPGIVFSTQQPPVEIRFDGTAPTADPNGIAFSIESSATFGNAQQAILLWNFQTEAYETLDTRNVSLEDDVYRVTVTTNASRFIEAGTLAMRAAVTVRAVGPSFAYPWTYRIDKAWWNLPG